MIRKFVIAAAAIAALGTASLAVTTTPADAKGKGWHHGHHFHGGHFRHARYGFYGAAAYGFYDSCLRRTWVINRYGESVLRTINVCY